MTAENLLRLYSRALAGAIRSSSRWSSMPFWLLKGQAWRAQAVLVIGTVGFLTAISFIATLL